jgi:hypothetical protein
MEQLLADPNETQRTYGDMLRTISWAPTLDQNASSRLENQPNVDRAVIRRAIAEQMLGINSGAATLPATAPAIRPPALPVGP